MAQEEWGWLSTEAMDYVAGLLKIKPIEVLRSSYLLQHVSFETV